MLPLKILLMTIVAVYGLKIITKDILLRNKASIIAIQKNTSREWLLQTNTRIVTANLLGESIVTPYLCILLFKTAFQKRAIPCIICRDSLGQENYRRLLVTLRMC